MEIRNVFAGIMTAYPEVAVDWYTDLFDRRPDQNPMDILYEWNFADGGVLQLVEDRERAGKSSITLLVPDISCQKKSFGQKHPDRRGYRGRSLERLKYQKPVKFL